MTTAEGARDTTIAFLPCRMDRVCLRMNAGGARAPHGSLGVLQHKALLFICQLHTEKSTTLLEDDGTSLLQRAYVAACRSVCTLSSDSKFHEKRQSVQRWSEKNNIVVLFSCRHSFSLKPFPSLCFPIKRRHYSLSSLVHGLKNKCDRACTRSVPVRLTVVLTTPAGAP